ncbi:hypothetical protein [Ruminococcus sp.]|uniref:hypothetical protein n=1 Tax=Ruminococcus sp. TaxID=41978 RepID=UPI0025D4683A|nr:hypothetical protein [Ruminococcus sp.]
MNIHELNRIIFNEAKQYLEQNANPLKYKHYFEEPQMHSLEEAFEVAVSSVRDITVTGGVIHYDDNYNIIKNCLFNFDYKQVLKQYGNGKDERYKKLFNCFIEKIQPEGTNSWEKFSKNICGVAEYLAQFDSIESMLSSFNQLKNADDRINLIKDIVSRNITLWKFKMVCNWLKDIGANGFAKPDSVLTSIFFELKLADKNDESVFKAVNLMAQDNNASVFFVDRVFWLIGTNSPTVVSEIERKKGKNKEDFIKTVLSKLNNNIREIQEESNMGTSILSEATTKKFDHQWIERQIKELSNGRYEVIGKSINEFYSIISKEEWKKINFHYELKWTSSSPIYQTSNINIRIHLESQHIDKGLDKKARDYFSRQGYIIKGNTFKEIEGKPLEISITPDFSSEKTAQNTIKAIIKKLDSDAYQQCAKIADECIEKIFGKAK